MRSGSRPAFRARRTSERTAATCTGRVPPALTIYRQLDRYPDGLNTPQRGAHGAARISRISAVIIPRSYNSRTFYLLADRLPVRSATRHQPREGWLARPAHLPTLFQAMLPEWQAGWRRRSPDWSGTVT